MTLTFKARTHGGNMVDSPLTPMWFPGGEAHIKGVEDSARFAVQIADLRGADPKDLIMLAMWADTCHKRNERTALVLPYLPGARADRGTPFGAGIYARLINSMVIGQVITLDPHSEVMPELIRRLTVFPFERIVKRELGDRGDHYNHPYVGVIAPDKGAVNRASRVAKALHVPLFKAEKHRDFQTGKLSGFSCEPLPETGRLLIADDICDGGGTFLGLADAIGLPSNQLDLWVTHGIFSKGFSELSVRFGHIYTTDSHYSHGNTNEPGDPHVISATPYLYGEIK